MTVDLTKARAGDIVHFRCGGKTTGNAQVCAVTPTRGMRHS
jgi:hypothetical protein